MLQTERDPVNELYDRGCDLVEAAGALRRAAAAPEGARAAPAVLGCIETALNELVDASAAMQSAADHAVRSAATGSDDARDRMRRGFSNLEHGLSEARLLAAAAGALAARALARADLAREVRRGGRPSNARPPAHRRVDRATRGPRLDVVGHGRDTERRRRLRRSRHHAGRDKTATAPRTQQEQQDVIAVCPSHAGGPRNHGRPPRPAS